MQDCTVNILGTDYSIFFVDDFPERLKELGEDAEALCERYGKKIYVLKMTGEDMTESERKFKTKQVLRHELTHAFLEESGLSSSSCTYFNAWPENEEMVDWFAIQSPKIFKVFKELDIL